MWRVCGAPRPSIVMLCGLGMILSGGVAQRDGARSIITYLSGRDVMVLRTRRRRAVRLSRRATKCPIFSTHARHLRSCAASRPTTPQPPAIGFSRMSTLPLPRQTSPATFRTPLDSTCRHIGSASVDDIEASALHWSNLCCRKQFSWKLLPEDQRAATPPSLRSSR